MAYLYISYSATDSAPAHALRKHLDDAGYHTWMDDTRELGTPKLSVLKSAIDFAAAVVVVDFGTDRFAYIVQWETNRAQSTGKPIFTFGKDMAYDELLDRVATAIDRPDERITLPRPLRLELLPVAPKSRMRRYARIALIVGVVGAILWLVLVLGATSGAAPAATSVPVEPSPNSLTLTPFDSPEFATSQPLSMRATDAAPLLLTPEATKPS